MSLITVAREYDLRIAIPARARLYRTLFLGIPCHPALLARSHWESSVCPNLRRGCPKILFYMSVRNEFGVCCEGISMAGMLSVKEVMARDVKVVREDTNMQEVVATSARALKYCPRR